MNIDNINDLPEKYRKQAAEKLNGRTPPKESRKKAAVKYRNHPTEVNGIRFDSKKEAQRYKHLMDRLKNGEISDLRLQAGFTLVEGFTTVTGERIRPERYVADFIYMDEMGERIVEDVKSEITRKNPAYRIKKKQMADKFGIVIREV